MSKELSNNHDDHAISITDGPGSDSVTRIARYQVLHPGTYWTAARKYPDDLSIEKGRTYLIKKIKYVDNIPHTVVLFGHPDGEGNSCYHLLVDTFLDIFHFEPDGEAIRAQEIAEIQAGIDLQKQELDRIQSDPSYLFELLEHKPEDDNNSDSHATDKSLSVAQEDIELAMSANIVDKGTSIADVRNHDIEQVKRQLSVKSELATRQALLLNNKTQELQATIKKLAPFYTEMGKAMEARASDAKQFIEDLHQGLATLGLYTGEDVQVITHHEGKPASPDTPLSLRQRLLYMDEEVLLNIAFGGADYSDLGEFCTSLMKDNELLHRVIPEERCLVAMQYRRRAKHYTDDPIVNALQNQANFNCFFLLRNGENIHTIHSSIEHCSRLFPTKNEVGEIFTGMDGETITIDDVNFADKRKISENIILHYKRILILLWGLYDRTDIIGSFQMEKQYGHLNILSPDVQNKCFNFIHDDENLLDHEYLPDFNTWVNKKNQFIRSGSTVYCLHHDVINDYTAPGCFTNSVYRDVEQYYIPTSDYEKHIVQRDKDELFIKILCRHRWNDRARDIHAKVNLSVFNECHLSRKLSLLTLDDVTLKEIDYYFNNRDCRIDYIDHIEMLSAVRDYLIQEEAMLKPSIEYLMSSLRDADFAQDGDQRETVIKAIKHWQATQNGKPVPETGSPKYRKFTESVMNALWIKYEQGRDRIQAVVKLMEKEERAPLRLVVNGKSHLYLYATPLDSELDTRLGKHVWVQKIRIEERKTKISIKSKKWVSMSACFAGEHVLKEWDEASDWVKAVEDQKNRFNHKDIQFLFDLVKSGWDELRRMTDGYEAVITPLYNEAYQWIVDHSKGTVQQPIIAYPYQIIYNKSDNDYELLYVGADATKLLWMLDKDYTKARIKDFIESIYASPSRIVSSLISNAPTLVCYRISLKNYLKCKKTSQLHDQHALHHHMAFTKNLPADLNINYFNSDKRQSEPAEILACIEPDEELKEQLFALCRVTNRPEDDT